MGELTTTLGRTIVDSGLASIVITGLLAMMMVGTRQPSRRRALARAGIIGVLLAIPLVCLRPYAPVDLAGPIRTGLVPTLAWIGSLLDVTPRLAILNGFHPTAKYARFVPTALLLLYLAGVLVGLIRFAIGGLVSVLIVRDSAPASADAIHLYKTIPSDPGRRRPGLRVSRRVRGPVLLGVFRTTILIPSDFDRPEAIEALRLGLLHELAHAEASDPLFTLASELAAIIWFPIPPLWWLRRQMRLDQEFLADRNASDRFGKANRYASSLVEIAATPTAAPRSRKRRTSGTDLFQRVLMLVRCPFPIERHPPRWWRSGLIALMTMVVLVATGITLRATSSAAKPDPRPEPRSFSMNVLNLAESPLAHSPASLPIRLPANFDLSLQVYATADELPRICILGHPIASERLIDDTMIRDPSRWHRVRLRRDSGRLSLALDDGPMTALPGESLEDRLTLRPVPGRRTTFRSIRLDW